MTDSVKEEGNECNGLLFLLLLIIGCFKKNKKCAGHLVLLFLTTASVKKDKECAGHLVFLYLLIGYRSCRHCEIWKLPAKLRN